MSQHILTRKSKFADAIVNGKYPVHRAFLSEYDYFEKLFNFPKQYEGLFPISIVGSDDVVNALLDTIYGVTPVLTSSEHVIEYLELCDSLFIRANQDLFMNHFMKSTYKEKCALTELYIIDPCKLYKTIMRYASYYDTEHDFETTYALCMNPEKFEKFVDLILSENTTERNKFEHIIRMIGVYLCLSQPPNWKILVLYMTYIKDFCKCRISFPIAKPLYLSNFALYTVEDSQTIALYNRVIKTEHIK